MKAFIRTSVLLAALTSAMACAADPPANPVSDPKSELGFLKPGKDYVIRFPESITLFTHRTSGISADNRGNPASWSAHWSVTVFRVVRLGGGSWALLEHPAKANDFVKWGVKRKAMAVLAGDGAAKVASRPDGKKRLEELREEANRKIETDEAWVNLDHAIAIAELPTEDVKLELKLQSVAVKPSH